MKANEVPEKVYLSKNIYNTYLYQVPDPEDETAVEYIRKDAFIEKAVKFMEKIDNVDEYSWYNEEEHTSGITEKCIEDFKKYMEDKL